MVNFVMRIPKILVLTCSDLSNQEKGQFVPVFAKGRFSHASCSNYRSILSSGSYYLEDFDYRSILVDSGIIVQWIMFDLYLLPSNKHFL